MIIFHGEKNKHKYLKMFRAGSVQKLLFTQQEVFGNLILSLDKIRKKLLVSGVLNPLKLIMQIDLHEINFIKIIKVYKDFNHGQTDRSKLEDFLETLHFHFEFSDGRKTVLLPIYERAAGEETDLSNMERRAVIWQLLLSKLKLQ